MNRHDAVKACEAEDCGKKACGVSDCGKAVCEAAACGKMIEIPGGSTLRAALKAGEAYLAACGIDDAPVDAWLLLEFVTGISRAVFFAESMSTMKEEERQRYQELLVKRGSHIPLQHLTGVQEFMGLSFRVSEHVLIPRQDTEVLAEETLKYLQPGMRVLDLCTGSGCIAVSLAKLGAEKFAKQKRAVGAVAGQVQNRAAGYADTGAGQMRNRVPGCPVEKSGQTLEAEFGETGGLCVDAADISQEALLIAQENAQKNGAAVNFIHSDLFAELSGVYDVIVSNPPYIRTSVIEGLSEEVRLHEPHLALDGMQDGLHFYRRIVSGSRTYLKAGGRLLFEIGHDQARQVTELMVRAGYEEVRTLQDLAGLDRVVTGRKICNNA